MDIHETTGTAHIVMSERSHGSMRVASMKTHPEILEHRRRFFQENGISPERVVSAGLVHGSRVHRAVASDAGIVIPDTDALITNEPRLYLSVTAADCVPVWFVDPDRQAAAIAHAGWPGIVADIAPKVVEAMHKAFDTDPKRLRVWTGPCIQSDHFEVQEDVWSKFEAFPRARLKRDGKMFIDLPAAIRQQLLLVGVSGEHLLHDRSCTACDAERWFSYRRDKPTELETMASVIGLRAR